MCFSEFIGYTCGHTSVAVNRPCPMTTHLHTNPCCPKPACRPIMAQSMCPPCVRILHGRWVNIMEYEHRFMHERGCCNCAINFPALQQPRIVKRVCGGIGSSDGDSSEIRIGDSSIESSDASQKSAIAPLYQEAQHDDSVDVSVRLPSLYAAEWTADHAKRHEDGLCTCQVSFEKYKPYDADELNRTVARINPEREEQYLATYGKQVTTPPTSSAMSTEFKRKGGKGKGKPKGGRGKGRAREMESQRGAPPFLPQSYAPALKKKAWKQRNPSHNADLAGWSPYTNSTGTYTSGFQAEASSSYPSTTTSVEPFPSYYDPLNNGRGHTGSQFSPAGASTSQTSQPTTTSTAGPSGYGYGYNYSYNNPSLYHNPGGCVPGQAARWSCSPPSMNNNNNPQSAQQQQQHAAGSSVAGIVDHQTVQFDTADVVPIAGLPIGAGPEGEHPYYGPFEQCEFYAKTRPRGGEQGGTESEHVSDSHSPKHEQERVPQEEMDRKRRCSACSLRRPRSTNF